jgi:hypothetical protein
VTSNFFETDQGVARDFMAIPVRAFLLDCAVDAQLALDGRLKRIYQTEKSIQRQRILVVGVEVPNRGDAMRRIVAQLADSRHEVIVAIAPMQPKGKFENIEDAISAVDRPLSDFDWLFIVDDDVALPRRFTDQYIAAAHIGNLVVSQPAHRFLSYATYQITRRRRGHLIRQTNFVEIGPLTVLHKTSFNDLVPFPASRWAYGIDLVWAECCRRNGWNMGIIDALPIRHLRPVAATYDMTEAIEEGRKLLERFDITIERPELFAPGRELA